MIHDAFELLGVVFFAGVIMAVLWGVVKDARNQARRRNAELEYNKGKRR